MSGKYSFTSSKTNTSKDMPLFLTKFCITFILPPALQEKYGSEILTEQVQGVTGLELDKMPEIVEQMYKGIKRRFGGTVADTAVDAEFTWAVNTDSTGKIYPLNVIRDWGRLIYNDTGVVLCKEDYAGSIIIEQHNVKGEVIRKIRAGIVFPMSAIPAQDLNYNEDATYELTNTFVLEDVEDTYID